MWISVGMAEDCLGLCLVIILFNYFFQIKEQTQLELRWKGAVWGDKLGHVQGVKHAVAEQVQHAAAADPEAEPVQLCLKHLKL